jgi:hypothetical protein
VKVTTCPSGSAVFEQITAVTRCEDCGRLGELKFSIAGNFMGPVRLGVECPDCDGRMMTIGRYGSTEIDGDLVTVLTNATEGELADIAAAMQQLSGQTLTTVDIASQIEALGTPAARSLAAWVRDNGGWFQAAQALATVIAMVVSILAFRAIADDDDQPIDIEKVIIHNDGHLTIETPSNE